MKTNKCWVHLAKQNNLRIKPSIIPNNGLGLFSYNEPFKRFHKLGLYTGRIITSSKLDRLYKGFMPPNSICKGINAESKCIDANQSSDGPLHYANNIRSRAKTNIGIKDIAKNIENKLIPMGYTLMFRKHESLDILK